VLQSKRRVFIYLLLFALIFINYIDRITLSVAGKAIAQELQLSPVELGYLFSSFLWSYLICLIPAGILTDRWGARKMAAVALTFWSIAQALTGVVSNFALMLLTRLGLGIGECPTNSAASKALREWAPASERGAAMAVFVSGSFIGPAIGAAFVGSLIGAVGWRMSFVITGLIGLVWVVVWLLAYNRPEETRWISEEERKKILAERETGGPVAAGPSASIAELLRSPAVWGVALTQGGLGYNIYLFLAWMPNYLETAKHVGVAETGFYTAIAFGVAGILGIIFSRFIDGILTVEQVSRGQRRVAVCISMLLAAASVVLIPQVDSLAIIVALIGFSLTFTATGISMNFTLTGDLCVSPQNIGKAFGLLNVGANGFGMLAPIVTGYVVQGTGRFDGTFYVSAVLMMIGAVITMTMTRSTIGARVEPSALPSAAPAR
jgi:ACS family glucarate transporter-like MFS transporter